MHVVDLVGRLGDHVTPRIRDVFTGFVPFIIHIASIHPALVLIVGGQLITESGLLDKGVGKLPGKENPRSKVIEQAF